MDSQQPLRALFRSYFKQYRNTFLLGCSAIIVVDIAEIILPLYLKKLVDSFDSHALADLSPLVRHTLIGIAAIVVVQSLGRYLWRIALSRVSMQVAGNLRENLSLKLFLLPFQYYDRKNVSDLMTLATSDVENMRLALGAGLIGMIDALFYCVALPIAMVSLAPTLTVKLLIPIIGIPFTVIFLQRKIAVLSQNVQKQIGLLGGQTQEMIAGVRIARIYGIEKKVEARLHERSKELNRSQIALARLQAMFGPSLEIFLSVSLVLLFGMSGGFTVGTLVAMQRYLQKLMWPMSAIGLSIIYGLRARASGKVYYELSEEENEPGLEINSQVNLIGMAENISEILVEAKQLDFTYPLSPVPVFENFSFQLRAGEWLGVAGSVAQGKSTLISLILKLYPVPAGQLFVLGRDVNDWSTPELRKLFSPVLQDPYLFQGSIRQNLSLVETGLHTAEWMDHALFTAGLPHGLHRMDAPLEKRAVDFPADKNSAWPLPEPW
jgi:ATP-binding cassette subfamily B multidrug efflux pump